MRDLHEPQVSHDETLFGFQAAADLPANACSQSSPTRPQEGRCRYRDAGRGARGILRIIAPTDRRMRCNLMHRGPANNRPTRARKESARALVPAELAE